MPTVQSAAALEIWYPRMVLLTMILRSNIPPSGRVGGQELV